MTEQQLPMNNDELTIIKEIKERCNFITEEEVNLLLELNHDKYRLTQVLVKLGGARFSCSLQDLNHLIHLVTFSGKEYVRDVSVIKW